MDIKDEFETSIKNSDAVIHSIGTLFEQVDYKSFVRELSFQNLMKATSTSDK